MELRKNIIQLPVGGINQDNVDEFGETPPEEPSIEETPPQEPEV